MQNVCEHFLNSSFCNLSRGCETGEEHFSMSYRIIFNKKLFSGCYGNQEDHKSDFELKKMQLNCRKRIIVNQIMGTNLCTKLRQGSK